MRLRMKLVKGKMKEILENGIKMWLARLGA